MRTHSYGGRRGAELQLDCPYHLAVDSDSKCVFVADSENARIVLLSPTLLFERYVIKRLSDLHRLHVHRETRRLYVGHWDGDVTVIQLHAS